MCFVICGVNKCEVDGGRRWKKEDENARNQPVLNRSPICKLIARTEISKKIKIKLIRAVYLRILVVVPPIGLRWRRCWAARAINRQNS